MCHSCFKKINVHGELCENIFYNVLYCAEIGGYFAFNVKHKEGRRINEIVKFMEKKKLLISFEQGKDVLVLKPNFNTFKDCEYDECLIKCWMNMESNQDQ